MAQADILSQDEIDALLGGVGDGDIETDSDESYDEGDFPAYDFTSQDRIVRGRMPTLEMVNERLARHLRLSLFNLLRRSPEVSVGTLQTLKFSEYVHGLFMPACMNLVRVKPLRGTGLITFDPNFIFTVVDNFFGGTGRFHAKIEGRDFTPTELRVIRRILDDLFVDLAESWQPVLPLEFEYTGTEVNPHFANIVSPAEVVVVSVFHVELEGGGGDIHITLPYSMIEPIRHLLDTGVQSDRDERDERWLTSLRQDIETSSVQVGADLTQFELTLRELLQLAPGTVIPIEVPATVTACVDEVPVFHARWGVSPTGHLALKMTDPVRGQGRALLPVNVG